MKNEPSPQNGAEEPLLLSAAYVIMRKHTERALAPWNLTVTQALTLGILDGMKSSIMVSRLARLLIQESPSTSTLVDRMVERGLVDRLPDPKDRRKALIKLTRKGRSLLNEVRPHLGTATEELFKPLSVEQRAKLTDALRTFRDANIRRLK
jgi:DNA-binding MarR family transcriptional regulator